MLHVHSEVIRIEDTTMIISGVPDKCKHVFDGTGFSLGNGEFLPEKKYRCPTDEATYEYIQIIAEEKNTYISGGGSCCSICGKQELTIYELMTKF